jgi:ABC-type nickel/cobalt efflux system permease component RcnA
MFGLALTIVAALAIAFASYRIGNGQCNPDADKRDADRNTSIVVIAIGFMFLLCGVLSAMSGSWNPMNSLLGGGSSSASTPSLLI